MAYEESMRRRRSDASEDALEMIANAMPDGGRGQLLRSLDYPALEQGGDTHQRCPCLLEIGMLSRESDRRLPRMLGSAPDGRHQPRSAGDGLTPGFWIGQADEQAPPVVNQRHRTGRQLTAMQVVRGETAPTPLVLEFIKGCLLYTSPSPRDRTRSRMPSSA